MTWVAVAVAGAAVVGGVVSSNNASKAATAQQNAANSAAGTQMSMFNTITGNEQPYNLRGQQATNALGQFYGLPGANGQAQTPNYSKILSNLPGYQFQLQQGTQAVNRNLAASGLLQSGAAGKELQQYGQGLAQNYAGQYATGLGSLAQLGQAAASNQASAGINAANNISSSQIYAGNAAAQGSINTGNAINAGLGQAAGGYGLYSSYQNPGYGGNPSNLGGSTPQAPPGQQLTYDSSGNITGYVPLN